MQPEHMLTHSMTPLYTLKTTLVPFANTGDDIMISHKLNSGKPTVLLLSKSFQCIIAKKTNLLLTAFDNLLVES